MEFFIEKTNKTPEVSFNPITGHLRLNGRSIPENPAEFFIKLEKIIDDYNNKSFSFEINLDYFNSSSSKNLLFLLKKSKSKFEKLKINWYSDEEDSDNIDFIKSVEELLNHKIKIIKTAV